jgi:hypothetical protein
MSELQWKDVSAASAAAYLFRLEAVPYQSVAFIAYHSVNSLDREWRYSIAPRANYSNYWPGYWDDGGWHKFPEGVDTVEAMQAYVLALHRMGAEP